MLGDVVVRHRGELYEILFVGLLLGICFVCHEILQDD